MAEEHKVSIPTQATGEFPAVLSASEAASDPSLSQIAVPSGPSGHAIPPKVEAAARRPSLSSDSQDSCDTALSAGTRLLTLPPRPPFLHFHRPLDTFSLFLPLPVFSFPSSSSLPFLCPSSLGPSHPPQLPFLKPTYLLCFKKKKTKNRKKKPLFSFRLNLQADDNVCRLFL